MFKSVWRSSRSYPVFSMHPMARVARRAMFDHIAKARRRAAKKLLGWLRIGRYGTSAWVSTLLGRPYSAFLGYGHLIREVQDCCESMAWYQRVDRLIARFPEALGEHALDNQSPQRCVFFIGYGRSGHSLVGSLLDAHPNIVISHELNALRQFHAGYGFDEVARAIKYNAYFFNYFGRNSTSYDYKVPGQYQGCYADLQVVGDKKGNGTAMILRKDPGIIERLHDQIPVPFQFIHVIRNPFDIIATRAMWRSISLPHASEGYFANASAVHRLKQYDPERVIDVYLEDLIANPAHALRVLLQALRVDHIPQAYLDACTSIVFGSPSRSREKVKWDPSLVRDIRQRAVEFPFLKRFVEE